MLSSYSMPGSMGLLPIASGFLYAVCLSVIMASKSARFEQNDKTSITNDTGLYHVCTKWHIQNLGFLGEGRGGRERLINVPFCVIEIEAT